MVNWNFPLKLHLAFRKKACCWCTIYRPIESKAEAARSGRRVQENATCTQTREDLLTYQESRIQSRDRLGGWNVQRSSSISSSNRWLSLCYWTQNLNRFQIVLDILLCIHVSSTRFILLTVIVREWKSKVQKKAARTLCWKNIYGSLP